MDLPYNKNAEVLIRKKGETHPDYGLHPSERSVEDLLKYGLIVLNKQSGPTSHQVTDYVKKILKLDKAGHSGTLDPNVSGVLVLALGHVTRAIDVLLKSGKEYVCLMTLHSDVSKEKIRAELLSFVGKIEQMPPMKSAVKRRLRTREIYYIEILEIEGRQVLFRVGCEAGTYIRTLCADAGKKLGTRAHMQELVRTKVAHFTQDDWVSLHDLKDAFVEWEESGNGDLLRTCIKPIEDIALYLPKVWIFDSAVDAVCHGAFLSVRGVSRLSNDINVNDVVAILSLKDELIGFGVAKMNAQNIMRQDNGIAIASKKIFMPRGTYPPYKSGE